MNFTFKLSNSYSKFILIMNTQEQHKNNKPRIFNPKNKRIETQNIPKFVHKFFHKNQLYTNTNPDLNGFFFFSFLFYVLIRSRFGFGANPIVPFLPPQNQQHHFTSPTLTPKQHNPPPQPLVKRRHTDHKMTPWPPRLIIVLINRVSVARGRER